MGSGRLTALDASFLKLETSSAHMHVAWRGRFEPSPGRAAITLARVRAQVASRLDAAPRFRQRLAFPPGGFANPVWVDDRDFDLARHVTALSRDDESISRPRFDALGDGALSQPLERSKPLWAMRAARSPTRLTETLRRTALAVGDDVARPAPASHLNVKIGPGRTLVGHSVDIEAMLKIKRARRASLNDVALTVVAGALRELAQLGEVEPAPLKVMVPVSRRAPAQAGALGNRIAFVGISLPVHLRTPLARLEAIRAATQAFKQGDRAAGGEAIMDGLGLLPGPLQAPFVRYASSARMYNLVVSNVPGPRFPVYLLGAECVEVLPVIPLSEGHALSIGVFSMRNRLCFGGYADPAALPNAGELPGALAAATAELAEHSARRRGGFRLVA